MSLRLMLSDLWTKGRVRVPEVAEFSADDADGAAAELAAWEQQYRVELPGEPPPLDVPAAIWAAQTFYRGCQLVVFRHHDETAVDRLLGAACPAGEAAAVHYSVDLTFRWLPDLLRLARAAAEHDPLLTRLLQLAGDWPLSSVGLPCDGAASVPSWIEHPCLRAMYVDRILARRDVSRLADPHVRSAVAAALGAFPDLSPEIAAALQKYDPMAQRNDRRQEA